VLTILPDNIRLRLIARAAQAGFKLRGDEGEKIVQSYIARILLCAEARFLFALRLITCHRSILFPFSSRLRFIVRFKITVP
jgi:hypothetical protein